MTFIFLRIELVLLICTSSRSVLSVCNFCILPFLLGIQVVPTNLVRQLGYLSPFAFGILVFSLFCPYRIFPSIFCTAVPVRVYFLSRPLSCLNRSILLTSAHVIRLLLFRWSSPFFRNLFFNS